MAPNNVYGQASRKGAARPDDRAQVNAVNGTLRNNRFAA